VFTPQPEACSVDRSSAWRCRALAALLILAAAVLRLLYVVYYCPLDLAPDEAHYWDWSRHLDWSYYSKGPLVAYLIRAGCALAGDWSAQLTSTGVLAVRLPAVICGSLLLVSLYTLTVQVFGRERLALGVVALALTVPVVGAGASLMTIDAPYTCLWGWALVLGHRAICRPSSWAWPALGLVLGLGILAKYTMVLWIPSAALFLIMDGAHRRLLFRRGFWLMTGIAALCCLPMVIWNIQHNWVSVRHVSAQAGLTTRPDIRWHGPVEFIVIQCLVLLVIWFVAWVHAMLVFRPWKETDPGARYLWWMSSTMFAVFLLFSLKTHEEPNWAIAAYLSGMVLMAANISRQLQSPARWLRRWASAWVITGCVLGLAGTLLMYHSGAVQPLLLRFAGAPTPDKPYPLRKLDPTCRLRGWHTVAAEVDRSCEELRQKGAEPLLAASSWNLPGELGFYCKGNPTVYTFGIALGDRHSQYDLWQPNPISNPEEFRGKTFVYLGELTPALRSAFDEIAESRDVVLCSEHGIPFARWTISVCRGFRGFANPAPANVYGLF
jgi:hypothetical protein